MKTVRRGLLSATSFMLVLLSSFMLGCGADKSSRYYVVEEDAAIWRVDGSGRHVACYADGGRYEKAETQSGCCYVFFDLKASDFPLCVIECTPDRSVRRVQRYTSEEWRLANAIEEVTWLRGSRIFVDTHVNPSLGFGIELDLNTQEVDVYAGCVFTWDRDRKRVAYFREPPHFGTPPEIPSKLMVGHTEVCEVPRRLRTKLRWHPAENKLLVLIPPEDAKPGQLVVVDFSSGAKPEVRRFRVKSEDL